MKEIEKLQRRIHCCECVHLGLMTLALAFPLILTFQSDDRNTQILLALGTVIPVQLIRFLCERTERKALRLLSSLAVVGLSILLTWTEERWSVYLLCCVPILISGVFLPRSKGRILLTVPSPWAAFALLAAYSYGRAVESYGVPLIAKVILILTALTTINYFIYTSQTKLLTDIRGTPGTEVSVSGMIRQNRKTLFAFLLLGALILTAFPFLLRTETAETPPLLPVETGTEQPVPVAAIEPGAKREYGRTGEGRPLRLETIKDVLTWILILIPTVGVILSIVYAMRTLLDSLARTKKIPEPKDKDGLCIERLEVDETRRKREKLTGWEKKIRRRYEKLILRRTPESAALNALTPTELERAADVRGPGAEIVHRLYSETRYSEAPADRDRYAAFKEAVKALDPPGGKK